MVILAAPGDTWGISGPDFLRAYVATLIGVFIVALIIRFAVTRKGQGSTGSATTTELALLAGGASQAIYACLAGLRTAGAVGGASGKLTQTGPLPAGADRLDRAVYAAAGRGVAVAHLRSDAAVQASLAEADAALLRSGWLLEPAARGRARLGGWLMLAVVAFGVVRIIAGTANGKPVGNLVALVVVGTIVGFVLLAVPRNARAGRQVLRAAQKVNKHLAPAAKPSWATYGAPGATLGVALFGTAAIWAADPGFAQTASIPRMASAGSGSDGGGGGGCGGGGCGGGCGG